MILHKRFRDTVFSAGERLRRHRAQEAPGGMVLLGTVTATLPAEEPSAPAKHNAG